MPSLLEQLENNEAVLLMYLSGELPDEDRDEVKQMLSTDAQMAAELTRLRAALADSDALIASSDGNARLPIAADVAVRNTVRAMRQWRLTHPEKPPQPVVKAGLPYPWWAYPTSAAAMVLLAALAWWGIRPDAPDLRMSHLPMPSLTSQTVPVFVEGPDERDAFVSVDPLDQAYLELRSIHDLAEGL
ncbi:MAG TPA: hypothetical protein VGN72_17690 [Tepidisphaeraceae bacterium]|jgi:hypothetical protein|nr:hypothetical protein [Tepidisphaeraceae bacterium]